MFTFVIPDDDKESILFKKALRMKFKIILSYLFFIPNLVSLAQNPIFSVDSNYLSRHDIVYNTPAYEGFEGLPLGNGDLGGLIWNNKNGFEIQVNKNDLFDQKNEESRSTLRNGPRLTIDLGAPAMEWIYLDEFKSKLSLKNAEVSCDSKTPFMETSMSSWISLNKNVWFIRLKNKCNDTFKEGTKIKISLERWGSRTFPGWYGYFSKNTTSGLTFTKTSNSGSAIVLEGKLEGLEYTVACKVLGENTIPGIISSNRVELESSGQTAEKDLTIVVSFVTSNESSNTQKTALELVNNISLSNIQEEKKLHESEWNKFWKQSFVHLENDYIENIYYLRRYLIASASRGKLPVVFNGGLWTWNHDVRNWVTPHHWNTQQQYWGLCVQNDGELMLPYLNTYYNLISKAQDHALARGVKNTILFSEPHDFFGNMTFWDRADMLNNFTPASQIAGLFWEYFQYTQDSVFLANKAYPFMKKAAEFYIQSIKWDSLNKHYYIFPSQAYESPRSNQLLNPITDRNCILSNFSNCIKAAQFLDVDQNKIKEWKNVIEHIWPIPYRSIAGIGEVIDLAWYKDGTIFPKIDDHGKWLNAMSQNTSIVYPSGVLGLNNKGTRAFNAVSNIIKNHSASVNAISPDPIVAARIGLGNEALRMIDNGIRRLQHFPQGFFYNIDHWYNLSIYKDSLKNPELSAQRDYIYDERSHYPNNLPSKPFVQCGLEPISIYGTAINEMLLQSNEDVIHIFPAVPDKWSMAFTLLARGGFLVSAELTKNGEIPGVWMESKFGNLCKIVNPWPNSVVSVYQVTPTSNEFYGSFSGNIISFKTTSNASYLITNGNDLKKYTKPIYRSNPNQSPKYYFEAVLGKNKNF
jgi:alpha-L-fucosidase 2